jgi:hypothetical protein
VLLKIFTTTTVNEGNEFDSKIYGIILEAVREVIFYRSPNGFRDHQ